MIIHTEKILNASDVMTPNPRSLRSGATLKEAMVFLVENSFSAAPVVNEAGRTIGVLSLTDVIRLESQSVTYVQREKYESANRKLVTGERVGEGYEIEQVPTTVVDEIMSPLVFCVRENTPLPDVIQELLAKKVHRVFVVDSEGTLIGVISSMDILRAVKSASF